MDRRQFLLRAGGAAMLAAAGGRAGLGSNKRENDPTSLTLFLCGDVMTGRGIDQALPHPSDPTLHESYVRRADRYVELAEAANGSIPRPMAFDRIWGDALAELDRVRPDARIVNLETAVTRSDDHWPGKAIHYRMHPDNVPCLTSGGIDLCSLANNHVLDWGRAGLEETLATLERAGIGTAGAGLDGRAARAPAILDVPGKGRVLLFAFGTATSGIPTRWAAGDRRPGVHLLDDLTPETVRRIATEIRQLARPRDVVVASIHWGPNWGYPIPRAHRAFAHGLVDEAGVHVVHGHSSHHALGVEIYGGRPILYGCGDFVNDYEGIGGHERYRGDLALAWYVTLDPTRTEPAKVEATPFQMRRFRLERASDEDIEWLSSTLARESRRLDSVATRGAEESGDRILISPK